MVEGTFEDRVRELAHALWEDEGRPEGRADEHWALAERLIREDVGFGDDGPLRPQ